MLPQEAAWLDGFWAINNRRDFQRAVKATILAAICKHQAAVAHDRDAEILEILSRQFRQHPAVNQVVAECRLVLRKV